MRSFVSLLIAAMASTACSQRAAESAACAKRALEQMAAVRDLRATTSGSLDFEVWLAPDLPTARVLAALRFDRGAAVLHAASCARPDSEAVLRQIQSALTDACGVGVGIERTDESCENLPIRSPGLGYVVDGSESPADAPPGP
jgi:hypothetical protein